MARIKEAAAIICCCAVLAVVLLLGAALVALYFTVLRPRPPRVVASAVDTQLNAFNILPPELNISLAVEVTLHNPNHALFRYGEVVTEVTYHGTTVGRSTVAPGKIPARSSRTVGVRVQVDAGRVIPNKLYVVDVVTGALPFQAATVVAGKAAALRPFKASTATEVVCSVILYPFRRESSWHCTSTVHVT